MAEGLGRIDEIHHVLVYSLSPGLFVVDLFAWWFIYKIIKTF